jgi:hypothetical protein
MAIPTFTQAEQPEQVEVSGSCDTTTGTTAPSAVLGAGFTITKPAAGRYLISFTNAYPALVSFTCSLQKLNATDDFITTFGAYTAASGSTGASLEVWTTDGATPGLADPTDDVQSRIHFSAKFKRKSAI